MPIHSLRATLTALVMGAALASLAACADQPTAPFAARSAPSRLLVTTPGSGTGSADVGAGGFHSCATSTAGVVSCWGDDTYGQVDVPSDVVYSKTVQLAAGSYHTCALSDAGAVQCWGDIRSGATAVPAGLSGVAQVSAGLYHSCAVATGGAVTCWGTDNVGQLDVPAPAQTGTAQLDAGYFHTCAVSTAGAVTCWGYGTDGQATVPAGLGPVKQVSAGAYHTCALSTAGGVTCWGLDNAGQTDVPDAAQRGIVQISAGSYHTCALNAAGAVLCWGLNNSGQANVPSTALSGIAKVSAGGIHTCALSAAGALYCWGANDAGQTNAPASSTGTTTHVYPTATFSTPATVIAGQPITLALTNAQVPNHPEATTFTYAFDCGSGTLGTPTGSSTATCATSVAGTRTVRGQVIDRDGDATIYTAVVTVLTPTQATQTLRTAVATSGISAKVAAGLLDKLDAALVALGRGQTATATSQLAAFQLQVQAQRGKAIPVATADAWLAQTAAIIKALGG